MIGTINTGSYRHRSYIDDTLNGTRNWVLQPNKIVAKIMKAEQFNQSANDETLRFRYTIYVNKRFQFNVMQDQLEIGGKFYMVVADMLNGKWVLE